MGATFGLASAMDLSDSFGWSPTILPNFSRRRGESFTQMKGWQDVLNLLWLEHMGTCHLSFDASCDRIGSYWFIFDRRCYIRICSRCACFSNIASTPELLADFYITSPNTFYGVAASGAIPLNVTCQDTLPWLDKGSQIDNRQVF
jgi:hypothetical protein